MTVSLDGTPIAWHKAGTGPPAVLVHGGAGDRGNWIGCTVHLATRMTLYAVDRRGRGRSGDAPDYAIEREYEDVAVVVDHAADRAGAPVTLIGHSYGAVVSLGALRRTQAVARVVLYEPPLLVSTVHDTEELATRIELLVASGDRSAAVTEFLTVAGASPDELVRLREFEPAWRQLRRDVPTVPRELRALRVPPAVEPVPQPVLLLLGTRSPEYLRASTAELAATLPAARVVELPGQGHLAAQFAPEQFCAELLRFLAEPGAER